MNETTTKEQGVRFGRAKMVHARSPYRKTETACGLGGAFAPELDETDDAVDCRSCLNILAIRRRPHA